MPTPLKALLSQSLFTLCLAASYAALAAVPSPASEPLGYDAARHLLNRVEFTASDREIRQYARLTRLQAADRLLAESRTAAQTPAPDFVNDPITPARMVRQMSEEERKAFQGAQREKGIELRAWWYREMLATSSPLTEKMTLFWHNHFVSNQEKVKANQLMYRQNVTLRRNALGNFRREGTSSNKALEHILKVEANIGQAASGLNANRAFATEFPSGPFGNTIKTACQVVANSPGVPVLRLSLTGFDTHNNQPGTQARLLKDFAAGITALKSALLELGKWNDTLILTYAEFGRRPRENQSNGTDHGTSSVHFAVGGRVQGGLYGEYPSLERLNGDGNLAYAIDFRSLYATALEAWWGVPSNDILGARFAPLPLLRS